MPKKSSPKTKASAPKNAPVAITAKPKKKKSSSKVFNSYVRKIIKSRSLKYGDSKNISVSADAVGTINAMVQKLIKDLAQSAGNYTTQRGHKTVDGTQIFFATEYVLRPNKQLSLPGLKETDNSNRDNSFGKEMSQAGTDALLTFKKNTEKKPSTTN